MTSKEILNKAAELQILKGQDYTSDVTVNQFENFERAGVLVSWFKDPVDQAFAVLIGTKLARLSALLSSGREPNNESIEDSFVDLTNYSALWGGYRTNRAGKIVRPEGNNKFGQKYYESVINGASGIYITLNQAERMCEVIRSRVLRVEDTPLA